MKPPIGGGTELPPSPPGDGIVQPTRGERCDDQAPGASAVGCLGCQIPVCGNGIFEGNEQCDDRNTRDGDGCSAECRVE